MKPRTNNSNSTTSYYSTTTQNININKYQYGRFRFYSTISTIVPVEVKEAFIHRCRELGFTPSEVLRNFIQAFITAEIEKTEKAQIFNINVNIAKAESKAEARPSFNVKALLLEEQLNDILLQVKDLQRRAEGNANEVYIRDAASKLLDSLWKTVKDLDVDSLDEEKLSELKMAIRLLHDLKCFRRSRDGYL